MVEFNREEELENLNVMVEERLSEKQLGEFEGWGSRMEVEEINRYERYLDNLQWAKEFTDAYERKHKNIRIGK